MCPGYPHFFLATIKPPCPILGGRAMIPLSRQSIDHFGISIDHFGVLIDHFGISIDHFGILIDHFGTLTNQIELPST
jgi:hypothetical protein